MPSKFSFHVCLVKKPLDLGTSIVTKDLEMSICLSSAMLGQ